MEEARPPDDQDGEELLRRGEKEPNTYIGEPRMSGQGERSMIARKCEGST